MNAMIDSGMCDNSIDTVLFYTCLEIWYPLGSPILLQLIDRPLAQSGRIAHGWTIIALVAHGPKIYDVFGP